MVVNSAEHIGEPGLGINAIPFGGLDQRIGDGGRSASAFGSGKKPVLASDCAWRARRYWCPERRARDNEVAVRLNPLAGHSYFITIIFIYRCVSNFQSVELNSR